MVGMESRKLNSSAVGRSMPTSCPAAMVDIDREVPGKIADSAWHSPIQMDCPRFIDSVCVVYGSKRELHASTAHMMIPPASRAIAIAVRLPRFLSLHFFSASAGMEVQMNATMVSESGWVM